MVTSYIEVCDTANKHPVESEEKTNVVNTEVGKKPSEENKKCEGAAMSFSGS